MSSTNTKRLLAAIDELITSHGSTNPALLKDLLQLRTDLQKILATRSAADLASVGFRLATWLKFIFDTMDDGP